MEAASHSDPLVILIDLEKRIRSVSELNELKFVFVNETHGLVPYRQAILFSTEGIPVTFSGVATTERNSPLVQWLKRNISPIIRKTNETRRIAPEDLDPKNASEWASWLPSFGLLQPLNSPSGEPLGILFLVRDRTWSDADIEILDVLAGAYGHAWAALVKPRKRRAWHGKKGIIKTVIAAAVVGSLALPVPLTVLAPAEIVAVDPATIRAPVEGVVKSISVQPNQIVNLGDTLFKMDAASQRNELAVAQRVYDSLKAQYAQVSRRALSDPRSKRYLSETAGRIKEQETKILYFEELIKRMNISAPMRGSVIIDDPSSWEGRPVNLGEKIMNLADQKLVEVEAWLSVADAIDLPQGTSIRVYLNSNPLVPVDAVLRTFSYEAQSRPEGNYAHRITGEIVDRKRLPRLGLRGTARLEGRRVLLAYWLFRRPISALRQFIGF